MILLQMKEQGTGDRGQGTGNNSDFAPLLMQLNMKLKIVAIINQESRSADDLLFNNPCNLFPIFYNLGTLSG
jgi:hypothetical protein